MPQRFQADTLTMGLSPLMPYLSSLISAQGLLSSSGLWFTASCTSPAQHAQPPASPSEGSAVPLEWEARQEDALNGRRRLWVHTQSKVSLNHTLGEGQMAPLSLQCLSPASLL